MFLLFLGFLIGIIVTIIILSGVFFLHKKNTPSLPDYQDFIRLFSENLPFGIAVKNTISGDEYFNTQLKTDFSITENETAWQTIKSKMNKEDYTYFSSVQGFLYNDHRGFEMPLSLYHQNDLLIRGFYLPFPVDLCIIFLRLIDKKDQKKLTNMEKEYLHIKNELKEKLAFYQQLMDDVPSPIWFRDTDGEMRFSNQSAKALKISAYLDAIPTDKYAEHWHISEKRLSHYQGFLGTAKKQPAALPIQENDISLSRDYLFPALDKVKFAIALFDADGYLQWYNLRLSQIWNIPPESLDEKPNFQNFFHLLNEHGVFRHLEQEQWFNRQTSYFHTFNGTEIERLAMGNITIEQTVIRAGNQHLAWIFEDVSDNFALQRNLRTAKDVRSRVLDSLPDALMLISSTGRIEYTNPALNQLWDIPSDFFKNNPPFSDFISAITPHIYSTNTELPTDEAGWRNLLMDKEGAKGEIEIKNHLIFLDFESKKLPDNAQIIRWQDRTAEKTLSQEKELRHTALQSALERMQAFIRDVSIEVRQPTGNILSLSQMLSSERFGGLNSRQSEYANALEDESKKLSDVTQDILDVASIDAGKLQLDIQPSNILNIAHAAFNLIDNRIKRYQQKIKADIPTNLTLIDADTLRLKQILYSLLCLAADYSRSPGSIQLVAQQDIDKNKQLFIISFSCKPTKKLHPMLNDKSHIPIEVLGQIELTNRLIELHDGALIFSYQGDHITMNLQLPIHHINNK